MACLNSAAEWVSVTGGGAQCTEVVGSAISVKCTYAGLVNIYHTQQNGGMAEEFHNN